VLPTRYEGFPWRWSKRWPRVSRGRERTFPARAEVVDAGISGERPPIGDVPAFAAAIAALERDRGRLESMSAAARGVVASRFDIRDRVADYQRCMRGGRSCTARSARIASAVRAVVLDHPWIPNPVVRLVRTAIRAAR